MTDINQRVADIEQFLVAATNAQDEQGGTEETKAQAAEALARIEETVDTTPNANGHSPRMLRDWRVMVAQEMERNGIPEEQANANLELMFRRIENGELNADGSPRQ